MYVNRRRFATLLAFMTLIPSATLASDILNVGAYPTNPPFEFKNSGGEFEGFEIDIIKEAAKRMNMSAAISDYSFQGLFSAISSGRIDAATSSITITPKRLTSQSFTQPYFDSDLAIGTTDGGKVNDLAELKSKAVGAVSGSTGEMWIKENTPKFNFSRVAAYETHQQMILDLSAGRVDAIVGDFPNLHYGLKKIPGLTVSMRIPTGESFGIMMPKGHPLLAKLNDTISAMKTDGTIAAFYKKWLEVDAEPDSSTVNVRPLPKE